MAGIACHDIAGGAMLNPGSQVNIQVDVGPAAGGSISGITVEVAVHTASGKMYPYSVLLP